MTESRTVHPQPGFYDAIVVGAGAAGLMLARRLKNAGKRAVILEKSAGLGGRLATRRTPDHIFDHGAQFLKIPTAEFARWSQTLNLSDTTDIWFSRHDRDFVTSPGGITSLAKKWADGLEIKKNSKVTLLQESPQGFIVETEAGEQFEAGAVYLSCPAPQSVALLEASQIEYPADLNDLQYAMALVGLFGVETSHAEIQNFEYTQDFETSIFSVSNQWSKKVSSQLAFTVVMSPNWSSAHFDQDEVVTLQELTQAFESFLSSNFKSALWKLTHSQLKKWRYSHPLKIYSSPHLALGSKKNLILLGDAFGGPQVLGAVRSALSVPV